MVDMIAFWPVEFFLITPYRLFETVKEERVVVLLG